MIKHRAAILGRSPLGAEKFDVPLRTALTALIHAKPLSASAGSAPALRYLRDRISVPRDMPLHAARRLRQALEGDCQSRSSGWHSQGRRFRWAIAAIRIPSHSCRPLLAFSQLLNVLVPVPRLRRVAVALGWALASCIAGAPALSPLAIPAAGALELRGVTYFSKAPGRWTW